MNKENKNLFIVGSIIILVICAYYFGASTRQMPTAATNLSSKCDTDAKSQFDSWQSEISTTTEMVNFSYQNHYNSIANTCYMLLSDNFYSNNSLVTSYMLYDIWTKNPYGNLTMLGESLYSTDGASHECNISAITCGSINDFLSATKDYLTK